ncbi:MAG: hypothetical protein L0K03_08825 [Bifidobacterium crudilactis]|nr:hypothetical protein [Bifidobacterium crudilactis]
MKSEATHTARLYMYAAEVPMEISELMSGLRFAMAFRPMWGMGLPH